MKILYILWLFLPLNYFAQASGSRAYIKNQIIKWGECKNVALTMTGGDVALYGTNGYATDGVPAALLEKLKDLNNDDELIEDIVLTENDDWMIIYGHNGISSYGAPSSLFEFLENWNNQEEIITSVTFNDYGEWIAISETKYGASSDEIIDLIKDGEQKFGEFWAAHLTNDGLVLCFENGYKFQGNVPTNLKNKLKETKINVFRIQFLEDGTFFFADKNGAYEYYM